MQNNVISLENYLKKDWKECLDLFEKELNIQEKSKETIKAYKQDVKIFFKWFKKEYGIKDFKPWEINKQDIIIYKKYMEKNYSHSTVNRKITSLKNFFNYFIDYQVIKTNPVEDIKYIEYDNEAEPKSLTNKEKRTLITVVNNDNNKRNKAIMSIFMSTGIRADELVNLNKNNFQEAKEEGGTIEVDGKGHKYRVIPIPKGTTKCIKNYLRTRKDSLNPLFISERRHRIAYSTLRYAVKNYFKKAGIKGATIHTLRHTAAIDLARKHPLHVVKKILGHSDITTTQIYLQARDEEMKKATDDLDYF